jgi:hypothetical protein
MNVAGRGQEALPSRLAIHFYAPYRIGRHKGGPSRGRGDASATGSPNVRKDGLLPHEFGVFVRSSEQLNRAQAAAEAAGDDTNWHWHSLTLGAKQTPALIDTGAGHYCPGGRKLTVFWAAFFRRLSARRWSCSAIAPLWLAARDTAAAPCWRIAQPLFGMPLFPAKVCRSMPSAAAPSCFRRAKGARGSNRCWLANHACW